jgi:glycosyltransferase involved in cell wall biosynthesis
MSNFSPTPEISIIIPVYRRAKVVSRCIRSIKRQSFTRWEMILVDDCSPDNSLAVLHSHAARDPRIRVLAHSVNSGPSRARFTGLEAATGRYVVFIDSDDWMPRQSLQLLYDKIESTGADMVMGSMAKVIDRWGIIHERPRNCLEPQNRTTPIEGPELMERYFLNYFGVYMFFVNMWGRIYRRETIERAGVGPVDFPYGEDMMFNMALHPFLKRIDFVTDLVYCYRWGGMTSTSTPHMLTTAKGQFRFREKFIERYDYAKAYPALRFDFVNCFYTHFRNLVLLDGRGYDEVEALIVNELRDDFYNGFFDDMEPSPKVVAMRDGDVGSVLDSIRGEVSMLKFRHGFVKFLSRLFN